MALLDFRLPVPPARARTLYLVFHVTRAFRLEAALPELGGERYRSLDRLDDRHPYPNVIAIYDRSRDRGAAPLRGDGSVEFLRTVRHVQIRSMGEAPDLVHLVYEGEDQPDQPAQHWFALAEFCPTAQDRELDLGELEPFVGDVFERILSPGVYLRRVDEYLDGRPGDLLTPFMRFFSEMDARTHPHLLRNSQDPTLVARRDQVDTWVSRIGLFLHGRVLARSQHVGPAALALAPLVDQQDLVCLEELSAWFLDIVRRQPTLVDANGTILLAPFEEAFELFAAGALRFAPQDDGVFACQPSSSNYLQFAELGFLAHECGFDVADWLPLLNVLVRSQEIFLRAYAPSSPYPRTLDQYTACNFDPLRPGHSLLERQNLAQAYMGSSYEQMWNRATRNARMAIVGPNGP